MTADPFGAIWHGNYPMRIGDEVFDTYVIKIIIIIINIARNNF